MAKISLMLIIVLVSILIPRKAASGALDIFNIPVLKNIAGPVVWVSHGWATSAPNGDHLLPDNWRGGLGLRYHTRRPLNPDAKDPSAYDTTFTSIERLYEGDRGQLTSSKRTYTIERKTRPGLITLSVGYMLDNGFRMNTIDFEKRLPLKGPYAGVFVVPDKLRLWGKDKNGFKTGGLFVGAAAEFLDIREKSVVLQSGSIVKIGSPQTVAPEFYVGANGTVFGFDGFMEISWQSVQLQSISYSAAGLSTDPPQSVKDRLPRDVTYHAIHLTVGTTFSRL